GHADLEHVREGALVRHLEGHRARMGAGLERKVRRLRERERELVRLPGGHRHDGCPDRSGERYGEAGQTDDAAAKRQTPLHATNITTRGEERFQSCAAARRERHLPPRNGGSLAMRAKEYAVSILLACVVAMAATGGATPARTLVPGL